MWLLNFLGFGNFLDVGHGGSALGSLLWSHCDGSRKSGRNHRSFVGAEMATALGKHEPIWTYVEYPGSRLLSSSFRISSLQPDWGISGTQPVMLIQQECRKSEIGKKWQEEVGDQQTWGNLFYSQ